MGCSGTVLQNWMTVSKQLIPELIVKENKKPTEHSQIPETTQINHKTLNKSSLPQMVDKYVDSGGRRKQTGSRNIKRN